MIVPTAFTPVSARRTFAHQPSSPYHPPEPVAAPPPQKRAREWPPAVREYVQRSFAEENLILGITKKDIEGKLKDTITRATESEQLWNIDWGNLALPHTMILEERKEALTIPIPAPSPWANSNAISYSATNQSSNGKSSKKRKSGDDLDSENPPWRQTNSLNAFEERLSYADKRQKKDLWAKPSKSQTKLESRARRFDKELNGSASPTPWSSASRTKSPTPEVQGPVVGRCQDLEKKYFRLTSAPNPDHVRPLSVLENTLTFLKDKWRKENNYSYVCDQFKSLRQDLTVQHIKTDFTVNVYEIHARIALEKGDLGEYNQCQTQLRALYQQNIGGHPEEFKAYRILYFIHTCNRTDMNDVLADLTPAEKKTPAIKNALEARSSLALGNYHRFFQLYLETPNMGAYLMDMFIVRERLAALANICKAYVFSFPLYISRYITNSPQV
jgi:hypothetical protein